jgi:hypothetical protein
VQGVGDGFGVADRGVEVGWVVTQQRSAPQGEGKIEPADRLGLAVVRQGDRLGAEGDGLVEVGDVAGEEVAAPQPVAQRSQGGQLPVGIRDHPAGHGQPLAAQVDRPVEVGAVAGALVAPEQRQSEGLDVGAAVSDVLGRRHGDRPAGGADCLVQIGAVAVVLVPAQIGPGQGRQLVGTRRAELQERVELGAEVPPQLLHVRIRPVQQVPQLLHVGQRPVGAVLQVLDRVVEILAVAVLLEAAQQQHAETAGGRRALRVWDGQPGEEAAAGGDAGLERRFVTCPVEGTQRLDQEVLRLLVVQRL